MSNGELLSKLGRVINSCQTISQLEIADKYSRLLMLKLYPTRTFEETDYEGRLQFLSMVEATIDSRKRIINLT